MCVCGGLSAYTSLRTHATDHRSSNHRIFTSPFSSLPSFVNFVLVFFPLFLSLILFTSSFFFFLDRSFQPVSISVEISVMRDSTKVSELARVCTKGRAKRVFATSRNCFEKSFSSMKIQWSIVESIRWDYFFFFSRFLFWTGNKLTLFFPSNIYARFCLTLRLIRARDRDKSVAGL